MARPRRDSVERALHELLSAPGPLYHQRQQEEPIWLLFVYLDKLSVAGEYRDARFQMRLRYGGDGRYQEKYSQKVKATSAGQDQAAIEQGSVVSLHGLTGAAQLNGSAGVCERWDARRGRWNVRLGSGEVKAVQPSHLRSLGAAAVGFGAMLVFRWNSDLPPVLTFDLLKLGFSDTLVSRSSVTMPFREGAPGLAEQELLFVRKQSFTCSLLSARKSAEAAAGPRIVGHLGVAVELRRFSVEELEMGMAHATLDMASMLSMATAQPILASPAPASWQAVLLGDGSMHSAMGIPCSGGAATAGVAAAHGGTPVVVGRPVPRGGA